MIGHRYPKSVKIVEVAPRDGLQNETTIVPTDVKVAFIDRLSATGLRAIEATSFVRPDRIPQLADAAEVYRRIDKHPDVTYPVLVPNEKGMERALEAGVQEVAVFTAASETFNRKNINCSIAESIARFVPVMELAQQHSIRVRGYVSCVLGCPYEGMVDPNAVDGVVRELIQLGCYEVSLGDTIGVGTPLAAMRLVEIVARHTPVERLALHFHDTRGQALANILACLELGVATVDASVAGLGGCPYAKGATGNVATEDVVYMLHGMGIRTGIDLPALVKVGRFISEKLGREPMSKLGRLPLEQIESL
ncbi:MAG TPA: hydroxymethylglutaryl-CoA lyase [Gammaproteobacteria bacterium]|nr:hydroxymethylglutaryl-CoA lyase [Gammaproteobacteria bacterium]